MDFAGPIQASILIWFYAIANPVKFVEGHVYIFSVDGKQRTVNLWVAIR